MTATPHHLEAFAPVTWATPFLTSPHWRVRERSRDMLPEDTDRFVSDTIRSYNGIELWLELYEKPEPGSETVTKTVTLIRFGLGLNGFPGICHGGAVMTIMDEALAFAMIANETVARGEWGGVLQARSSWIAEGRPLSEVLEGYLVTAKLDFKFLKPVLCPGVVGVEVDMLENKGHKMKMRAVMKDADGVPLMQADGVWVRIGGGSRL
ncbi:hypothetical protein BDV95DRAFT_586670 [Massariosphaeria phaeospora]|uniref:Thioesterase domain-containing protein n=1 Tax=Massariosphaeria phaeospora TaxID=100035 RepID=A0A7C8M1K9_9PLEO|nr:hypothetical protein BDV95DRAFT_586670 [Massariosphaeria phaeospora]